MTCSFHILYSKILVPLNLEFSEDVNALAKNKLH